MPSVMKLVRAKPRYKKKTRKPVDHSKMFVTHSERKVPSSRTDLIYRAPVFARGSERRKLFYYDYQISLTGTAGALANDMWSANGCFDPDIDHTGHQPIGFDQMMLYYEQYTVVASKITVCFLNNGTNAIRAAISLSPDTTVPTVGNVVENGLINYIYLDSPGYNTGAGVSGRIKEATLTCDVASYFGRKTQRELLNDTTVGGTAAANPTEQVYYAVMTWGAFFTDNTAVAYDVTIEYDVIFWEPRKIASS